MTSLITTIEHNEIGQITKIVKPLNNYTTFEYDKNSRLTAIKGQDGCETSFDYYECGCNNPSNFTIIKQKVNLNDIDNPIYINTKIVSDKFNNLIKITNLNDNINTTINYDSLDRIVKVVRESGSSISFKYDAFDRIIENHNLLGGKTTINYSDNIKYRKIENKWVLSKCKTIVNPNGDIIVYYYNILDLLIAIKRNVEVNDIYKDVFWIYEWDKRLRLIMDKNPLGRTTKYNYDTLDRLVVKEVAGNFKEIFQYNNINQIIKYTDPKGNVTNYKYDSFDRINEILKPLKDTYTICYDSNNNISSVNHNGSISNFQYDSHDTLISFKDPNNNTYNLNKDLLLRTTSLIDPYNNVADFIYDSRNNIIEYINFSKQSSLFTFDNDNSLIESIGPGGQKSKIEYTTYRNGMVASTERTMHGKTYYKRDKTGRITCIKISELNIEYSFKYNSFNNLTEVVMPDESTWRLKYDEIGRLKTIKSPEGRTKNFSYSILNMLILYYKDDFLEKWHFKHDKNGNVIEIKNPLGGIVKCNYDELNRLSHLSPFENKPIKFKYDIFNRFIQIIDSNMNQLKISYNKNNLITQIVDQEEKTINYKYNKLNYLTYTSFCSQSGKYVEKYNYYPSGKIKDVYFEDGSSINLYYDESGNLQKISDEENLITNFIYDDVFNSPTTILTPENLVINRNFDAIGRTTEVNSIGKINIKYDDLNRIVTINTNNNNESIHYFSKDGNLIKSLRYPCVLSNCRPQTNTTETIYSYDKCNRLKCLKNSLNNIIEYNYNDIGQLECVTVNGSTIGEIVKFNKDGNIEKVQDANGFIIYEYNHINGFLERIVYSDDRTTIFEYYKNGLLKKIRYSDGNFKEYYYDYANKICEIIDGSKKILLFRDNRLRIFKETIIPENINNEFIYYKNGRIKAINDINYILNKNGQIEKIHLNNNALKLKYYENGLIKKIYHDSGYFKFFEYDVSGNLIAIKTPGISYMLFYDCFNNIISIKKTNYNNTINVTNFFYDTEEQLVFITKDSNNITSYNYDKCGNIISIKNDFENINCIRTFDWSNQMIEIVENSNVYNLNYDSKGNLILIFYEDTQRLFNFDDENKLKSLKLISGDFEKIDYDAFGRIISDTISDTHIKLKHAGIYNIEIRKNSDKIELIPDIYNFRPIAFLKDDRIIIPTWVAGNILINHDEEGNILSEQKIDPYGDNYIDYISDFAGNSFCYKGYYSLISNNIKWAFSRFYDTELKYFLSQDRVITNGSKYYKNKDHTNKTTINRRKSLKNNPLKYTDFLGLNDYEQAEIIIIIIIIIITENNKNEMLSPNNYNNNGSSYFQNNHSATIEEISEINNVTNITNQIYSKIPKLFENINQLDLNGVESGPNAFRMDESPFIYEGNENIGSMQNYGKQYKINFNIGQTINADAKQIDLLESLKKALGCLNDKEFLEVETGSKIIELFSTESDEFHWWVNERTKKVGKSLFHTALFKVFLPGLIAGIGMYNTQLIVNAAYEAGLIAPNALGNLSTPFSEKLLRTTTSFFEMNIDLILKTIIGEIDPKNPILNDFSNKNIEEILKHLFIDPQ